MSSNIQGAPLLKATSCITLLVLLLSAPASVFASVDLAPIAATEDSAPIVSGANHDTVDNGAAPLQQDNAQASEPVPPDEVPPVTTPEDTGKEPAEAAWPSYEATQDTVSPETRTSDRIESPKDSTPGVAVTGKHLKNIEGILQRFRNFTGERTVQNLVALYETNTAMAGVTQSPAIAVSDGITPLTIRLDPAVSGIAPTFSFRGANLESLHQFPDGTWELQAIPQKGKSLVYLSIKSGTEMVDLPLTVIPVPQLTEAHVADLFSESRVASLLATGGGMSKMAYDLNADGKQDYLDGYILIGHYLLNRSTQPTPAK